MQYVRTALLLSALTTLGVNGARALVDGDPVAVAMPAGDGISSVMGETSAMALAGFRPARCATGEAPPAELLALADWPLDSAGTCVIRALAAEDVPVIEAQIRPIRALAEVAEASIRKPRDILDAYGDGAIAAPAASQALAYGDQGATAEARVDDSLRDYGDILPQREAANSRRNPQPAGPAPVKRPLRPILLAEAPVVDSDTLDTLRGGFELPSGLRVSFGIERAVYVNGVLSSVTTVNLAELGKLAGRGISPETLTSGSTLAVIQNGPNNTFSAAAMATGALATVIQNSLDNQSIRAVTTINATVNSMEMLRGGQMTQSVRDAMVHSLMR